MSVRENDLCFHCGQATAPGAPNGATIGGQWRAMCCPGCAAVAQTIVSLGQEAYYSSRAGFAAPAPLPLPELALYDSEPARFAEGAAAAGNFSLEGLRCGACVWLLEERLGRLPGVLSAQVNLATEQLAVRWDPARCQPSAVLAALRAIGYAAYPFEPQQRAALLAAAAKREGRRLFVAAFIMMQVMMYAAPAYFAAPAPVEAPFADLLRWASLLLCLPVLAYCAAPIFTSAWRSLRARHLGMDVPVALGLGAALLASAAATWRGAGEVYFDSVAMFVCLLLASRYLELGARRRAAAVLERLLHALPPSAQRLDAYPASRASVLVPAASLLAQDYVLVAPGQAVPADAIIVDGASSLDLSLWSGESAPQACTVGAAVPGGAINLEGALILRVQRAASQSSLAGLVRLSEQAGAGKPQLGLWADRAAARFVAGLLLLAAASFAYWQWQDPARAWPILIAVLVVSCPCALSLAMPTALAAAHARLLGRGILVLRAPALETLQRATHIVFDKTGTLSEGKPVLQGVQCYADLDAQTCLAIGAALEAHSSHPLAQAIVGAAKAAPAMLAGQVSEQPGRGLEGQCQGQTYRIGTAAFVAQLCGTAPAQAGSGQAVYLGSSAGWIARFALCDALRPDALATVRAFQEQGKQVLILSGDQPEPTARMAALLGVAEAHGALLPEQKLAHIAALQGQGAIVAVVGDGINDAAVLRGADVSFAMGAGAPLAQLSADAVLVGGRLAALVETAHTARRTVAIVRQNLAWAALYNCVAIPAAAFGLVTPWLAGLGMAASSAVVVCNALRLRP